MSGRNLSGHEAHVTRCNPQDFTELLANEQQYFCLEHRFSKHKILDNRKFWGLWPLEPPSYANSIGGVAVVLSLIGNTDYHCEFFNKVFQK